MKVRQLLTPRLVRILQIAVLVGLVGLILSAVDWQTSITLLAAADIRWLVFAALILTVQTLLSALRWRMTAARVGIRLSAPDAIREYYLSQMVNQSLPGGVLGDAGRAVRARAQAGLLASGQAVLFERLAGQMGLLAVLIAGLGLALVVPQGFSFPDWLILPVALILCGLGCLALGISVAVWRAKGSNRAPYRFLRTFKHAVLARDIVARQASFSIATALCNVAAFAACALALGLDLPLLATVTILPLILFAMILPLSISGWGLREGAAAALFPLIGASASEGLATSVAFGLVFLATVLPGLALAWLRPYSRDLNPDQPSYDEENEAARWP